MTKGDLVQGEAFRHHHFVLIAHKRGVAYLCIHCGKRRYYGRHKTLLAEIDGSVMVYMPRAVALPHGVTLQPGDPDD